MTNSAKYKKILIFFVIIILLALIAALGVYFSPAFTKKRESAFVDKIKKSNSVFTTKILEEFNKDKNTKASNAARKVAGELNQISKNLFDKNKEAYVFDSSCMACSSVDFNDELSMVVLTIYDKKGELISRTVIKPPSFVTYVKGDE